VLQNVNSSIFLPFVGVPKGAQEGCTAERVRRVSQTGREHLEIDPTNVHGVYQFMVLVTDKKIGVIEDTTAKEAPRGVGVPLWTYRSPLPSHFPAARW
jgi:hypothetical protein